MPVISPFFASNCNESSTANRSKERSPLLMETEMLPKTFKEGRDRSSLVVDSIREERKLFGIFKVMVR